MPAPSPVRSRLSPPLAAALLVALVLVVTTDDGSFGVIPDGKEMLSAGAAVAFRGEIGVSRDFVNAVPREGGDAVSRYGMGQSLALVPFLWAARALHAAAPSLPSSPVLVFLPLLCLVAAAWGVSRAAAELGAPPFGQLFAGAAAILATPLWGYSGSDFSEPLQVALLSLGVAALSAGRRAPSRRGAIAAGALLGALPLVKSVLWIVSAPLLAAALFPPAPPVPESGRKKARTLRGAGPSHALALAASAAVPAGLWLALEVVRFGRPFGGYGGESFTYPFLTGLARLTVLPNKGLLVYAPVVLLAVPGLLALRRRDTRLFLAFLAAVAAVFASASTWWAWDGQAAWGPRLLLPALPLLLVASGLAVAESRALRAGALALSAAGALVNVVGALQPFPGVYALATFARPEPIPASRAEGTPYEITRAADGTLLASGPHHLSLTPGWWPPAVHARVLAERIRGGDAAGRLLANGFDLRPPLRPVGSPAAEETISRALPAFSWPFWGRSLLSKPPGVLDPLAEALRDQAVRDLDTGDAPRARRALDLVLAREGAAAAPRTLALAAEAALEAGDAAAARRMLDRSPKPCHAWIVYVRMEIGEDASACVPADRRGLWLANTSRALAAGRTVSAWAREARERAGGGR